MNDTDLNLALQTAEEAAQKAGKELLNFLSKFEVVNYKDGGDLATTADLAAEDIIKKEIFNKFPKHNFLGEEGGLIDNNSSYTWVVDSLDGTKNYVRGLLSFGISIALLDGDSIIVGVVYIPKLNDLYSAAKGRGAKLNGRTINVSQESNLEKSMIYLEIPHGKNLNYDFLQQILTKTYRARSFGMGALGLALVAQGAVEAYIDLAESTYIWDIAAGILLVEEAGGVVILKKQLSLNEPKFNQFWIACNASLEDEFKQLVG